jgi:hypothetical protein
MIITYSKGRRGREAFFHSSICPVIHPVQLKVFCDFPILLLLQQSPSSWVRKPQDVDPGAAAEAVSNQSFPMVSCMLLYSYLIGHKQCKHQDFQWPGSSRWIHAECGI